MPYYEFQDQQTGEKRDFYFEMMKAPGLDTPILRDGRKWKRTLPRVGSIKASNYAFVSRQERRWDADAPRHDRDGRPAFETRAEIEEFRAKKAHKESRTLEWGSMDDDL